MLKPLQTVPNLSAPLLSGEEWSLYKEKPQQFSLLVFYRGHHCPVCRFYLNKLSAHLREFEERGIAVVAISADRKEKAQQSQQEWHTSRLRLAYSFPVETARSLGLFVSSGKKVHEPELFFEPAVMIVRPDNTLYAITVQSMPFGRPHIEDILQTFDYIIRENYPPRGAS